MHRSVTVKDVILTYIDETCNNLDNPVLGSANTVFIRLPGAEADYADGISKPREAQDGGELPNARHISFKLLTQNDSPSAIMSHMAMTWGELHPPKIICRNLKASR